MDARNQRYLTIVGEAARDMGELIDALLDFSRMGRAENRETPVDLGMLVWQVKDELAESTIGRTVHWTIEPLPMVNADPALLRQVLRNLLSNAVKYTRKREVAEIAIGEHTGPDGDPVFYVRDNGAGFNMKYVDKLFGVFQRLHRTEEFEGVGIGLANVRRIIQRHGGRVWAEGEIGAGATFFFTLPTFDGGSHDGAQTHLISRGQSA